MGLFFYLNTFYCLAIEDLNNYMAAGNHCDVNTGGKVAINRYSYMLGKTNLCSVCYRTIFETNIVKIFLI